MINLLQRDHAVDTFIGNLSLGFPKILHAGAELRVLSGEPEVIAEGGVIRAWIGIVHCDADGAIALMNYVSMRGGGSGVEDLLPWRRRKRTRRSASPTRDAQGRNDRRPRERLSGRLVHGFSMGKEPRYVGKATHIRAGSTLQEQCAQATTASAAHPQCSLRTLLLRR